MSTDRILHGKLAVAPVLDELVRTQLTVGVPLTADLFWSTLNQLVADLGGQNKALLEKRDVLQQQIDAWYQTHPAGSYSAETYRAFLTEIGYLVPVPAPFKVTVDHVDPAIATLAGPQLVVPVSNARYALNAANARWGSLYDALYGTNVIPTDPGQAPVKGYDRARGLKVVAWAKGFLDRAVPLVTGSHADATAYNVVGAQLSPRGPPS